MRTLPTFRTCLSAAAALLVASLATTAAQAAPMSLSASSASWQAITPASSFNNSCYPCTSSINSVGLDWEAVNVGWNSSASYDSSAWSSYSGGWGNTTGRTPFYARTLFTIGTPNAGSLTIWADDDVHVWLNGTRIINDTDFTAGTGYITVNLLPHLTVGTNVLAFKAHNSAGGGVGANFYGSIDAQAPAPQLLQAATTQVPEPAGLLLVGLGLAAAAAAGRRGARPGAGTQAAG